jgi:hypothetical protein
MARESVRAVTLAAWTMHTVSSWREKARMHAALVSVRVEPEALESGLTVLREQVVPMIASAPGFVAGYWLAPENNVGWAVIVFETEEQAREAAPPVGPAPAPGATVERVDFRAVVASA